MLGSQSPGATKGRSGTFTWGEGGKGVQTKRGGRGELDTLTKNKNRILCYLDFINHMCHGCLRRAFLTCQSAPHEAHSTPTPSNPHPPQPRGGGGGKGLYILIYRHHAHSLTVTIMKVGPFLNFFNFLKSNESTYRICITSSFCQITCGLCQLT